MSGIVGQVGARSGIVGSTTNSTQLDYEEGDIPNPLQVSGSAITNYSSFTTALAYYIKIGNVCRVSYLINNGNVDIGTGAMTLDLPFTAHSKNWSQARFTSYVAGSGWSYDWNCRIYNGSSIVDLYAGSNASGTFNSAGTGNRIMDVGMSYMIA
tara:strand:- start:1826 stop:2287 length:462 start_codon:yes stop_codon:yes gene_type:complete